MITRILNRDDYKSIANVVLSKVIHDINRNVFKNTDLCFKDEIEVLNIIKEEAKKYNTNNYDTSASFEELINGIIKKGK